MPKKRVVNSMGTSCSEMHCRKWVPAGEGFYLGKRGKGRTDWYLCLQCDEIRKNIVAQKRKFRAAKKAALNKKSLRLFEPNNNHHHHHGCGCSGILP